MYPAVINRIQIKPYINFLTINLKAGIPVNFGTQGTFISIASSSGAATDLIQIKAFRANNTILDVTGIDDYWVFKMPGYDQEFVANYFDTLQLYSPNIDATVELYLGSGDVSIPGALAVVANIKKLDECVLVDSVTNVGTVAALTNITNPVNAKPAITLDGDQTYNFGGAAWGGSLSQSLTLPSDMNILDGFIARITFVAPVGVSIESAVLYNTTSGAIYGVADIIRNVTGGFYCFISFKSLNIKLGTDPLTFEMRGQGTTGAGSVQMNSTITYFK